MICVTIGRTRHKYMLAEYQYLAESGADMVEMRLDYIGRSVDLRKLLSNRSIPIVITCRRKEDGGRWDKSEEERQTLLRSAIASGVDYVDLEEDVAAKIPRYGRTKRIVSYHDFVGTPDNLQEIHQRLSALDADVVKIATLAKSFADSIRMLRFVETVKVPTIGICMGDVGVITRVMALRYGAPFTFATINAQKRMAPGQLTFEQMRDVYRVKSVNAETRLFGVVADPVAHSQSPLVHNTAFAADGLNCLYLPFHIPADDLPMFMKWCLEYKVAGLSVTIPHKEVISGYLDQIESSAKGIGAVNTVVFGSDGAVGYNTDYRAAMDCLTEALDTGSALTDPFRGLTALILGAGGAARAMAYGLRQKGANVVVASRSEERADEIARSVGGRILRWSARYEFIPEILINATPIGMHPNVDETPYERGKLVDDTLVFDMVYNPEQTLLLKQAREVRCRVIPGIEMFERQAAYQYKLFTGREPQSDLMRATLKRANSPVSF